MIEGQVVIGITGLLLERSKIFFIGVAGIVVRSV